MSQPTATPKRVSVTTLVWSIVGTAVGTTIVVGTIAALAFVLLLPVPTAAPQRSAAAAPTPTASASSTEEPAESAGAGDSFDGGIVVVGTDIQPGTYSTEGPEKFCFFAWKDGLGSDAGNVSYRTVSSGKATAELVDGDIFQSNGCTPWSKTD